MTRDEALGLVHKHTKNPNLIKHMLAVEAGMRAYAARYGVDAETWGIAGLVHDFDYEANPNPDRLPNEQHPSSGAAILRAEGWPEDVVEAVLGHADYTGVPRTSLMSKALYAVDELTGLIVAVALVRPSRKLADVDLAAIRKKWKEKSFAAGVERQAIVRGAEELGVPLDEHIGVVLGAMQAVAPDLGL
ncbi:MAG: HDIG domain-containing protein [Candidatus Latescibacterota bacterium]|nr:MAG: HDIG domain-containing protein [Candidatus Latescibacterota bacterium]